ncbi:serine hydrolase [Parerythrobacter aurantius]|uniref:serine hydrolase n=1 Tax=Parerythrobacter aurantius TaxID=3127706 RepID=UPI00324C8EB4
MISRFFRNVAAVAALSASLIATPAQADGTELEAAFDRTFGTEQRKPQSFEATYANPFERRVAMLADGSAGRIGVAAVDLASGQQISILGDQRFPMASTSKIAVAAVFLEGVEQGRWSLSSEFPLMVPTASKKFSTAVAPVRAGQYLPAIDLIELMITRSSNPATDALLKVVGGPKAVNDWARRNGIREFSLDRDIATLVRDDGEFDPATHIDRRDSTTPRAMVDMLAGLYQGKFLKRESRDVLLGAMSRTVTGTRRIPAMIPDEAQVLHKTGSLSNTSSDVGIIKLPDGRAFAVAIYVTGQGGKGEREAKIAAIARALYDGFAESPKRQYASAGYGTQ